MGVLVTGIRLIVPFFYCILVALGYGAFFKKKFSESLAPAFFIQMLVMIACGMAFSHVGVGIVIVCVLALVSAIKFRKNIYSDVLYGDAGVAVFAIFYVLLVFMNEGKYFCNWDEFSHWGIFLKETLRLDNLYCTSDAYMAHQDYVPAITMFEALWCKLMFRYREADAYRAIQMLGFSMVLPMIARSLGTGGDCNNDAVANTEKIGNCNADSKIKSLFKSLFVSKNVIMSMLRFIIVMLIPIFFDGNQFYHTIYQDAIFGFFIFFCVYVIYADSWSMNYRVFMLTLASTIMIMAKMTGMAILPMVWLLFVVKYREIFKGGQHLQGLLQAALPICVPVILWLIVNKFIDMYVPNSGYMQSYDGLTLSKVISIITHDGSISYQADVEASYVDAIFHSTIFAGCSYVFMIIFITIVILIASKNDKIYALWTFLAGLAYGFMYYFLYLMSFSEYEAIQLASYSRYMNSMLLAFTFIMVMIVFENVEVFITRISGLFVIAAITFCNAFLNFNSDFEQILPVTITEEEGYTNTDFYNYYNDLITSTAAENENVLLITRCDKGKTGTVIRYLVTPRLVSWVSPGPESFDGDIWYSDMSTEEFVEYVADFDTICFVFLDDLFMDKYAECFEDSELVKDGNMYHVSISNGKIILK